MKQSDITKRVLKIYDYLVANNLVENKAEFCRRINYHVVSFSKVQTGERDFPDKKLHDLIRAFYININYVMFGTGDLFYIKQPIMQIRVRDVAISSVKNKMIIEYTSLENVRTFIEFIMN